MRVNAELLQAGQIGGLRTVVGCDRFLSEGSAGRWAMLRKWKEKVKLIQ